LLKKQILIVIAMTALAFVAAACTSSGLHRQWVDPEYKGGPFNKVLVIALSKDKSVRKSFEEAFAKQFKANGVKSASGLALIPQDTQKSEKAVMAAARKIGAQAIFLTLLIVEGERDVSSASWGAGRGGMHGGFGGFYTGAYNYAYGAGPHQTQKFLALQSSLYELKTGKRIWSTQSQIIDPKNVKQVVSTLAPMVMADLKKNGLIK
jgi:hypothetical protein